MRLHVRWAPSELNVADGPSRRWEAKRPGKGGCFHISVQAGEEENRSFQQEGSAGLQQEDEHSSGRKLEREEQESEITIKNEGKTSPGDSAGASKFAEGQREKETESKAETQSLHPEAEGFKRRDEHFGDEQRQGTTEEGLLQEARRVLRVRKPASDIDIHLEAESPRKVWRYCCAAKSQRTLSSSLQCLFASCLLHHHIS